MGRQGQFSLKYYRNVKSMAATQYGFNRQSKEFLSTHGLCEIHTIQIIQRDDFWLTFYSESILKIVIVTKYYSVTITIDMFQVPQRKLTMQQQYTSNLKCHCFP